MEQLVHKSGKIISLSFPKIHINIKRLNVSKQIVLYEDIYCCRWLPLDPSFMKFLWMPNVFIYNLDTFDAMFTLKKLSGLWIIEKQEIFYNQVCIKDSLIQRVGSNY